VTPDAAPPPVLRVLSFGAGVQSTTVLLLSLAGDLPPLDLMVFADTGWEPEQVYRHLDAMEQRARDQGVEVVRVAAGNIRDDALRHPDPFVSMPLFVTNGRTGRGMLKRECTHNYKARPVQSLLGRRRQGRPVELVFGISADEIARLRSPRVNYLTHVYPLVDLATYRLAGRTRTRQLGLGRRLTRHDCVAYLSRAGVDAPRSACIGCPFHSDAEWRAIRDRPDEWADAVAFDAALRAPGRRGGYLHRSCQPLDHADLDRTVDADQLSLLDDCEGMCGV